MTRAGRAHTTVHVLGAVGAFIAIGSYTASRSPLGRLLPAGESPGFVWLREHAALFVWSALIWLLGLALLRLRAIDGGRARRPLTLSADLGRDSGASRTRAVRQALVTIEVAAIVTAGLAIVGTGSGWLAVAHSTLLGSILLQAVVATRPEDRGAFSLLDGPERRAAGFLAAAFVLAAVPLTLDPGLRALGAHVVLDSDGERVLARALPPVLSGITGVWAAAGLLGLLAAVRAIRARLDPASPLRPALDRLPFVLACGGGGAALATALAPAIEWELEALDLGSVLLPSALVVALVGGVLSHRISGWLSRAATPRTPPSPVGFLTLSIALLPVFPVVWWLARTGGRAAWRGALVTGIVASAALGTGVLFGGWFNPWFTVFSYLKWLLFKAATVTGAGILVLAREELRGSTPCAAGVPAAMRPRWGVVATGLFLPLTVAPLAGLAAWPETKTAVLQFSELAMVDASYARAAGRVLGLANTIRLGQAPRGHATVDPWPGPWVLERVGPSRLPRDFNLVVIVVDALRGDVFRSAGYRRDLTPFLDRWARDEAVSFRRAYSQGGGTFAAFPFLVAGRSRLNLYGPDLHRENVYLKLARSEGIRHVVAVHEFAPSALFPPDVRVIGPDRPRPAGPARSVAADEVLSWTREAIEAVDPGDRFFVYVHLLDVHNDLWKKADGLDFGDAPRDLYDNNVSYVDRAMARFVGWLQARGLYKRTVILFTSDHGEQFREHGATLHGHTLYEEELRVPLILLAHGIRGRVDDVPVVVADAVPTLLDLAGYSARPAYDDSRMGISLVPLLTGAERRPYLHRDVVGRASFKRTYFLYRDWRWKLIWSAEFDQVQLFDVAVDPGERRSLVQEEPALAAALERDLLPYVARVEGRTYRPLLSR